MPAARHPLLLLLFVLTASASHHLWSPCETGNFFLYDYMIADEGCQLVCLHLTSSSPERYEYLDKLEVSNYSLEYTRACQDSKYPATGHLCVTVLSAKFEEFWIPTLYPAVKFQIDVGGQRFTSSDQPRSPVLPGGRVKYKVNHCFPHRVSIYEPIEMFAMGSGLREPGDRVELFGTRSYRLTARNVLEQGKNGTAVEYGNEPLSMTELIITFTGG